MAKLQKQIQELSLKAAEKSQEVEDMKLFQDSTSDELTGLQEKSQSLASDLKRIRGERELLRKQVDSYHTEMLKLRNEISDLTDIKLESRRDLEEAETQLENSQRRIEYLEKESEMLEKEKEDWEELHDEEVKKTMKLEAEVRLLQQESSDKGKELQELLNDFHIKANETEVLSVQVHVCYKILRDFLVKHHEDPKLYP